MKLVTHIPGRRPRPTNSRSLRLGLQLLLIGLMQSMGSDLRSAPLARVYEYAAGLGNATGASQLLREAGFEVQAIDVLGPLETRNVSLIVLGSFLPDKPDYAAFMQTYRAALQSFVAEGGVLLQLTASHESEPVVPYLPGPLSIRRSRENSDEVYALRPQHPLVRNLEFAGEEKRMLLERHLALPPSIATLSRQRGFNVILATDSLGTGSVLTEGAHGRGRFLLTSLALDKQFSAGQPIAPPTIRELSRNFFANLKNYVEAVQSGRAEPVTTTAPADLPTAGSWTIGVVPDTQYYVDTLTASKPQIFRAQTEWLVRNKSALNIRFVLHLGDVTQNNTAVEWDRARDCMSVLDGQLPYAIVAGNHDYGPGGNAGKRSTLFSEFFPVSHLRQQPTFGGVMEAGKIDNSYHLFEVAGEKWLVVALEWGPRHAAVAWAGEIIAAHPDRRVIVLTHAYLYNDDSRYDWATKGFTQDYSPYVYGTKNDPGGTNDGEDLWRKLVSRHGNIALVINGHVIGDGRGFLSSKGEKENNVHQMLANFQMRPDGGEGYLRLLEIQSDQRTIRVRDYSPTLDEFLLGRESNFTFRLDAASNSAPARVQLSDVQRHLVRPGATVSLVPPIDSLGPMRSYQWSRSGATMAGATSSTVLLENFQPAETADYLLEALGADGRLYIWSARIEISQQSSRVANLSARGWVEGAAAPLTIGWIMENATPTRSLVRALGPTLERFGVNSFLRDPILTVFDVTARQVQRNDDWASQPNSGGVTDAAVRVGAAMLGTGGRDAALRLEVEGQSFTARCSSADPGGGVALVELFDDPGESHQPMVLRNASVLGATGAGERQLTLGCAISGTASRALLVRAVGPSLEMFGIRDAILDPVVSVYNAAGTLVARNDDWGGLRAVQKLDVLFGRIGAFDLMPTSRDSALLITLSAGTYTIQCESKTGERGSVLFEIYIID